MDWQHVLVIVNAGTLASVLGFGYRVVRFINRIEFKTEVMWQDFERRMRRIED